MAKVEYADMIKTVSGALTKINKKSQHAKDQKMVLATHRVAPTESTDCTRVYLRGYSSVSRTSALTEDEINARNRFRAVSQAVKARKRNLDYISTDQVDFMAQRNEPGGKKTMLAYLWKVCGDAYDQAHQG